MGHRRILAGLVVGLLLCGAASAQLVISTFDTGDEGWQVVSTLGYIGPVSWSSAGGNPGGFIYASDPDTGAWGFAAPAKFLDDKSAIFGGALVFDVATDVADPGDGWVGISGAGMEFVCGYAPPESVYPDWYTRSIALDSSAGWYDPDTFEPATDGQLFLVLKSLDGLVITGEFIAGPDQGALDNVMLIPEPGSLVLLATGLAAYALTKRR